MIASIGRKAISIYSTLAELTALVLTAFASSFTLFSRARRPIIQVFLRQLFFTGNEALQVIFVIGLAVGVAIISQMSSLTDIGRGTLMGKVFVWVVIRELGPLLTALVVIARSGSAIAIELGQMKFKGEIQYLETLGIPGEHYLLMPRILGVGCALFLLNIYFSLVAVISGFFVASLGWQIPLATIRQGLISVLTLQELFFSCAKSAVFGLVIAAVGCRAGLNVRDSITQIPQAGTKAVMLSLMLVFLSNVVISLIFLF